MTATAVLAERTSAPGAGQVTATGPVLWLVRHGETTWNARGLAQGHRDEAVLTRRGVRQAWAIAGYLCGQPIRTLYSSDLRRAMQTAAPAASLFGLPVIRDARLRERCLGIREGGPSAAISAADTGLREGRVANPDTRPSGGESLRDFYRRVAAFASDIIQAPLPGDAVIITHGGTLRMLRACLASVPVERMSWGPVANGCIVRLVVPAGPANESARRQHR
jgi:2,3-bisphosphoglycerate-dependent phosphoglycerate mutase